jgi:hypothetical protein
MIQWSAFTSIWGLSDEVVCQFTYSVIVYDLETPNIPFLTHLRRLLIDSNTAFSSPFLLSSFLTGGVPAILSLLDAHPNYADLHRVAAVVLLRMLQESVHVGREIAAQEGVRILLKSLERG